eukprot:GHVQ01026691.1.p1 GENE.GHVQ01026691.1~~GHVQ01026691.1.p1  ORF type:complete len:107 (-),score=10.08 GHVQ01026691.1:688-1008(-)
MFGVLLQLTTMCVTSSVHIGHKGVEQNGEEGRDVVCVNMFVCTTDTWCVYVDAVHLACGRACNCVIVYMYVSVCNTLRSVSVFTSVCMGACVCVCYVWLCMEVRAF